MKVYISKHDGPDIIFSEAERSNGVRIETTDGITFTVRANEDGSLGISESTHRHLAVYPRTSNAIHLGTVEPEAFLVARKEG